MARARLIFLLFTCHVIGLVCVCSRIHAHQMFGTPNGVRGRAAEKTCTGVYPAVWPEGREAPCGGAGVSSVGGRTVGPFKTTSTVHMEYSTVGRRSSARGAAELACGGATAAELAFHRARHTQEAASARDIIYTATSPTDLKFSVGSSPTDLKSRGPSDAGFLE